MTVFKVSQSLDFSLRNYDPWSSTDITSILGDLLTGVEQIHLYDREKGFKSFFDTGFLAVQGLLEASKWKHRYAHTHTTSGAHYQSLLS